MRHLALQQDGQRVGLWPIGATGAPDPEGAANRIPCDEVWYHEVAEGVEMLLVPKEVRFADRDLRDQVIQFGGAANGACAKYRGKDAQSCACPGWTGGF